MLQVFKILKFRNDPIYLASLCLSWGFIALKHEFCQGSVSLPKIRTDSDWLVYVCMFPLEFSVLNFSLKGCCSKTGYKACLSPGSRVTTENKIHKIPFLLGGDCQCYMYKIICNLIKYYKKYSFNSSKGKRGLHGAFLNWDSCVCLKSMHMSWIICTFFQEDLKSTSVLNAFHLGEWMPVSGCPTSKLGSNE